MAGLTYPSKELFTLSNKEAYRLISVTKILGDLPAESLKMLEGVDGDGLANAHSDDLQQLGLNSLQVQVAVWQVRAMFACST